MKSRLEFVRALGNLSNEISLDRLPGHLDNIAASLYGGKPVPTLPVDCSWMSLPGRMEIVAKLAQFITDWYEETPDLASLDRIEDIIGQILDPKSLPKHLRRDTCPDRSRLTQEEKDLLKNNPDLKINVIKMVRTRTGLDLKGAKDMVDIYLYQSKQTS
jgi:hypothetical protein